MWGNDERLEALLDCLIENAVKFTAPGDSIELDASVDGDSLVIEISDSGVGIPEQDLGQVFDIFHTGSSAGDLAGNGLGLAIVQAIVQARHGTIDVTSQVGVGTRFTLRLKASRVPGTAPFRAHQVPATDVAEPSTDAPVPAPEQIPMTLPVAAAQNS